MKRPTEFSEEIIATVAEKWAVDLARYAECKPSEALGDALKTLRDNYDRDPYKLARYLEKHCYWDGDSDLYEACDFVSSYLYEEVSRAVKEWAKQPGMFDDQPLAIGTPVEIKFFDGTKRGKIVKLRNDTAQYEVRTEEQPDTSAWIIDYEDSRIKILAAPEQGAATPQQTTLNESQSPATDNSNQEQQ